MHFMEISSEIPANLSLEISVGSIWFYRQDSSEIKE
jgi:hypothetical protein